MTRSYSIVLERGPSGLSAHVPELPTILVTGGTVEELRTRAVEAIQIYWEEMRAEQSLTAVLEEIEVELRG
ncbi:MAG: type II toxin-antitoxin system HicB family antitoxin [Acidobacteria bacterium]|nr:type II toxin-antitoxin system HicB family antitoxin [Acidobacteriota bacterium]